MAGDGCCGEQQVSALFAIALRLAGAQKWLLGVSLPRS